MLFEHRFVEDIPDALEPHVLYIALDCGAIVHLCACGCGNESVTPLGRTDWSVIYDGETASLSPSVGNWSFPCQSHYFIKNDMIEWAPKWTAEQIDVGRRIDQSLKHGLEIKSEDKPKHTTVTSNTNDAGLLRRIINWIFS